MARNFTKYPSNYVKASSEELHNNGVRLIDANALINKLKELEYITDDFENGTNVLEDIINDAPTIEDRYSEGYSEGYSDGYLDGTSGADMRI